MGDVQAGRGAEVAGCHITRKGRTPDRVMGATLALHTACTR